MRRAFVLLALVAASAAYAVPPCKNLERLPELISNCEARITSPKSKPLEVRQARFELLRLRMLTCEDAAFEETRAAFLKLISERGDLSAADYVAFLYRTVANYDRGATEIPDVDALADAATRDGDAAVRWAYVTARESRMRRARERLTLNLVESLSDSARLRFLEEMEADPRLSAHRVDFVMRKSGCLLDLGRDAEAEKLLVAAAATTNATELATVLPSLAGLYVRTSKRYFSEPHLPTVRKAYAVYDRLVALENAAAKPRPAMRAKWNLAKAEAALGVPDVPTAQVALAAWRADQPKGKEDWRGLLLVGDACFFAGHHEESVAAYQSVADKFLKLEHHIRCAEALFACERRREAIPHVAFAAKRTGKYQRLHYQRVLEKLNAEFKSEGKEQ